MSVFKFKTTKKFKTAERINIENEKKYDVFKAHK